MLDDGMVFDFVGRAPVDVVLMAGKILTNREICSFDHVAIPPGPGGFAWFDPGNIHDGTRLVEVGEEVGFQDGVDFGTDKQNPPGSLMGEFCFNFDGRLPGQGRQGAG